MATARSATFAIPPGARHNTAMAILKIACMGHPMLLRPAEPVTDPTAPDVKALVADMIETMNDAFGRGLAANQVHVPKRVVVFYPPHDDQDGDEGESEEEDVPTPPLALVNPELEVLTDETGDGWEGCLSVPGMRGVVPRYTRVRYRGTTPDGEKIDREVAGFHARVVQHELDHLDGIVYPMRMKNLGLLVFESEVPHLMQDAEPGERAE